MRTVRSIIVLALVLISSLGGFSRVQAIDAATQQHIQQLQAQIEALEAQAAQYRSNIASEQDKANSLNKEISILKSQSAAIQAEINATGAKIEQTNLEITDVQSKIGDAQQTLSQKREAVGRMILFLDHVDHENLLSSLFKYANLSDFLSQLHDLASIQSRVVNVIDDLEQVKAGLETDQTELQSKQEELQQLKDEADQRKASLDSVKSQKDKLLKDTKGQEALYQKQLTEVQKKQAAFFKEQQKLEAQVIAGGLYIVHVVADSIPPKGTKLFRKPEDSPHLTQGYGLTSYARSGAYGGSIHNGLDLASGYGTPIKAAANGNIIAHGSNDGWGNWIAIQHPNNLVTIYGHMSRFENLPVGTPVTSGQVIGYEGNTGNVTGSHVHFSVYREFFTYVNDKNGQLYFNYDKTLNPLDYL